MELTPTVLNKIKKVVFSTYEPSYSSGILWAKPDDQGGYVFFVFNNGSWVPLSYTGIIVMLGDQMYPSEGGVVYLPAYPTTLPASDVYPWAKESVKPVYSYSEIVNTPFIPSALSDLADDATHRVVSDTQIGQWTGVYEIVPDAAYNVGNELADKSFVNSSIATATANYKGSYNLLNDLSLTISATHAQIQTALGTQISQADNNDYCFVEIPTSDETPTEIAKVGRYKFDGTNWEYEYTLNNSSFTANQWAAINSGITSGKIILMDQATAAKYTKPASGIPSSDLTSGVQASLGKADTSIQGVKVNDSALTPDANKVVNVNVPTQLSQLSDDVSHRVVTDSEKGEWSGKYDKPSGGIPKTDLNESVQTSLGKADTALQEHQDISGKADKVASATEDNFAGLDANGNLKDSGKKASDFADASHTHTKSEITDMPTKLSDFTDDLGNSPTHTHSQYLTTHQDISSKADKVTTATNGNFAGLDAYGNLVDSGHKHSDYLTEHQDISGKADKSSTVTNVAYSAKKLTKTINGTTTDIVDISTIKTDLELAKGDVGLGNVDNKSSETIRGEITSANVTTALGYTPYDATNPNGYTSNIGTVTKVKVGDTGYDPASGVVSLPAYPTTLPASDVSAWAKESTKPTYNFSEIEGTVSSSQLPSYVDDVIEGYYKTADGKFYLHKSGTTYSDEVTPESGKIYIDLDTNLTYRWGGTTYVSIASDLALGETSSTAYRGDRGKIAYDHSQSAHARTDATKVEASSTNGNIKIDGTETTVYTHPGSGTNPHGTTKSDVGLGNVGNFKAVSTEANQGLSSTEQANARANIGAGTSSFSGSYNDLTDKPTIPTVPTNVSAFTNDAGYTTNVGTVTGINVGSTSYSPSDGVVSLPAYPTTLPASDVSAWAKAANKPSYTLDEISDGTTRKIPTKVSQLTNDSGFTTNVGTVTGAKIGSTSYSPSNGILEFPAYPTTLPASDVYAWAKASSRPAYTTSIATSEGTNQLTLAFGTKYALSAGDTSFVFTMPNNPDTWRPLGTGANDACAGNDSRLSDARPASDVYSWAKASSKPSYSYSEISNTPSSLPASDVYAWAKAANKPSYSFSEITGTVSSSQLPSYVDDVLEYASKNNFPATGESGKIYVALDTNLTWRWSGSAYVEISPSLALGTTSSTAYRGDLGNIAYTHSQVTSGNPHGVTKSDVGLGDVGNFKAVSTVASQGLSSTEQANARANIGAGTSSFSGNYNDLSNKPTIPTVNNSTITIKQTGISDQTFTLNGSATTITLADTNTWRPIGTGASDAAAGNHTHSTSIATSSGTNQLTLAFGTKYSLNAGGTSYIFTMPANPNTDHYDWSDITNKPSTYTPSSHSHAISDVSGLQTALDGKSGTGHTHTTSIATSSGTNQLTLAFGTKYALTAGGTSYVFTMPANPNTDHYDWSDITNKPSTYAPSSHTHSYAGSSSAGGAATSANKLNTDAGSATNPVYFSNGIPVACTYTLGKSVPSDAVFTDHTYNFSGTTFYSGNSGNAEHNANSAVNNGMYYYSSNGPSTSLGASTDDGALYVQSYSDSWVGQIAQDYRNGRLFVRGKNNGTWQNWQRIAITGESQPASDVYSWAKASSKPSYTASEVGALSTSGGTITGNTSTPLSINTSNSGSCYIPIHINSTRKAEVGWDNVNGAYLYNAVSTNIIQLKDDGSFTYNNNPILHSGNAAGAIYLDDLNTSGIQYNSGSMYGFACQYLSDTDTSGFSGFVYAHAAPYNSQQNFPFVLMFGPMAAGAERDYHIHCDYSGSWKIWLMPNDDSLLTYTFNPDLWDGYGIGLQSKASYTDFHIHIRFTGSRYIVSLEKSYDYDY